MKAKKLIASVLCLLLAASAMTSCLGDTTIDIDKIPSIADTSEAVSTQESEIETSAAPGHTDRPVCTEIINKTADHVIIAGSCEDGAVVTIKGGTTNVQVQSTGGYYIAEVILATSGSNRLEMTAKTEGEEESDVRVLTAEYKATVSERPDDFGVFVGMNSQLFLKKTLNDFNGKNLLSTTEIAKFKAMVNLNYDTIQAKRIADLVKASGQTEEQVKASYTPVKIIYVLVPNAITVYPELVPEEYVEKTNTTRYKQVVRALSEDGINASVIDMNSILSSHKNDGYTLFNRTDSNWSDYAAYLAYVEICKATGVTARPRSDFTIENKTVYGGDLAGYLSLNRELTKDTTTVLTPKFKYTFPTGTFYSTENPADRAYINNVKDADYGLGVRRVIKTNREELQSVMIYRDITLTPIYNLLADKYSMTAIQTMNLLKPRKVDIALKPSPNYVIIFCSESNLDLAIDGAMS